MEPRSDSPFSLSGSPDFSYPINTPDFSPVSSPLSTSPPSSPNSNSPPTRRSTSLRYSPNTLAAAQKALENYENPNTTPSTSPKNRALMLPDGSTVPITHHPSSPSSSPPKGGKNVIRPKTLPPKSRRSDGQKPEGEILSSSPPKPEPKVSDEKPPKPPRTSRDNDPSVVRSPPMSRHRKISNPERLTLDRRGMSLADFFEIDEEPASKPEEQPDFEKRDKANPYDKLVVTLKEKHGHLHSSPTRMLQIRPHELLIRLSRGERDDQPAGICYDLLSIDTGEGPVKIRFEELKESNENHRQLYIKILEAVYSGGNFAGNFGNDSIKDQVLFLFSESRFIDNSLTLKQIRDRIPAYPLLQALSPLKGGIFDLFQLTMPTLFPHKGREIGKEVNRDGKSAYVFDTRKHGETKCHVSIDKEGKATITTKTNYVTQLLVFQKNPLMEGEKDESYRSTRNTKLEIGKLSIITSFVLSKITREHERDLPYLKINIHPRDFTCLTKQTLKNKLKVLVTTIGIDQGNNGEPVDEEASKIIRKARREFMNSLDQTLKPGKYNLPNGNIAKIEIAKEKKK